MIATTHHRSPPIFTANTNTTQVSHMEPVRAFMAKPTKAVGEPQILPIWMEHMDGKFPEEETQGETKRKA
jgi:hypothetical protein